MSVLLLLGLPALAFAPADDTYIGQEPHRVRHFDPSLQHELRRSDAWTRFTQGDGAGWKARFDERTGTPYTAWGPGIPLDGGDLATAAASFLVKHADLLGIDDVSQLSVENVGQMNTDGTWIVDVRHFVPVDSAIGLDSSTLGGDLDGGIDGGLDGLDPQLDTDDSTDLEQTDLGRAEVYRGGLRLMVRDGKVFMMLGNVYPGAADMAHASPTLSADTALDVAITDGPAAEGDHTVLGAELVVLPLVAGSGLDHRLTWKVRTRTEAPLGIWVSFVDAMSGELLNVHNEIRFANGTITAQHDTRTVDGNYSVSPVPLATISTDSMSDYTDWDGLYDVTGSDDVTTTLRGSWLNVRDSNGSVAELEGSGDLLWDTDAATQAEIDSYIFLHQVKAWGESYAPEVAMVTDSLRSNVNLNSTCNAYYDGNVNFYSSGGGCNNTGRIADVNYHEWGHGFHYYSLEAGSWDGDISEGIGDVVSVLITGDSVIAPYFMTNGSGIRDAAGGSYYPDDWTSGDVHGNGTIFSGAVWDLWAELQDDYSEAEAYDTVNELFVAGIKPGPEIPESYDAFVAGDDDNGDLSDGTPNMCAIYDAFSAHGLGPSGSSGVLSMGHSPLDNQDPSDDAYELDASIENLLPDCTDFSAADAKVYYSTDDGESWESAALTLDGEDITGAIPAVEQGKVVQYYVQGEGDDGTAVSVPSGGEINPLSFFVGDLTELYCNDFESDDGGFEHDLLDGEEAEGADDWVWGSPLGAGGDPDKASSGDLVWGNDLGGGNFNGEYQDDKWNRLTSPAIDVSGWDQVVVQFDRWLNVEDGYYDQARFVVNDEEVWDNWATDRQNGEDHHQDEQWAPHTHLVQLDGAESVSLAWEIESDGGLTFGGWNIDNVCVYGYAARTDDGSGDDGVGGTDSGADAGSGDAGIGGDGDEWSALGCGCATADAGSAGLLGGLFAMLGLVGLRRREG